MQSELHPGRFLRRYKRFFADIEAKDGSVVIAHVANTGSLKGCLAEGAPCLYSKSDDPKRKLKATLERIKTATSWVGVNTGLANALVWKGFNKKSNPRWEKFDTGKPEVKVSADSRLDFMFANTSASTGHFVEVKSVSLAENQVALFPDAVSVRAQKHLNVLEELIKKGATAEIVFVVQRADCHTFAPAHSIDPVYAEKLKAAQRSGVVISAYPVLFKESEVDLDFTNPLRLDV